MPAARNYAERRTSPGHVEAWPGAGGVPAASLTAGRSIQRGAKAPTGLSPSPAINRAPLARRRTPVSV